VLLAPTNCRRNWRNRKPLAGERPVGSNALRPSGTDGCRRPGPSPYRYPRARRSLARAGARLPPRRRLAGPRRSHACRSRAGSPRKTLPSAPDASLTPNAAFRPTTLPAITQSEPSARILSPRSRFRNARSSSAVVRTVRDAPDLPGVEKRPADPPVRASARRRGWTPRRRPRSTGSRPTPSSGGGSRRRHRVAVRDHRLRERVRRSIPGHVTAGEFGSRGGRARQLPETPARKVRSPSRRGRPATC
jgi:hypothetical protein